MFKYEITTQVPDIDMGIRMIGFHAPCGFMQVERCLEGELHFVQGKGSGCITLADYLERNALSDQQFSELLVGLVQPLQDTERFYIDGRYIEYSADRIFYNYDTKSCAYVYGSGSSSNENEAIQSLIREIIYERARLIKPNSEFVSSILSYLKEPGWHLRGLQYILENQGHCEPQLEESYETSWEIKREIDQEAVKEKPASHLNSDPGKQTAKKVPGFKKQIGLNEKFGSRGKNSIGVIGVLVVLSLLFILPVDMNTKIGGGIILLATVFYVSFKIKQKADQSPKAVQPKRGDDKKIEHVKAHADSSQQKRYKKRYAKAIPANSVEGHGADVQRTALAKKTGHSQALIDSEGVIMPLKQRRHVIGRLKNYADILIRDDDTIGRQHAELIKIEAGYAVNDLNSINGTYVNHIKVIPGQPIVLREGDVLSISETDFKYSC